MIVDERDVVPASGSWDFFWADFVKQFTNLRSAASRDVQGT